MEQKSNLPLHYRLQKLIVTRPDLSNSYPWIWEHNRWKELVYAILARMSDKDQNELHTIADQLLSLGLLDVSLLSEIDTNDKDNTATMIVDFLEYKGFEKEEAWSIAVSLKELASGLKINYRGKIQELLRRYGVLLLEEASKNFTFSFLKKEDVDYIFIFWLQNVMNVPLSLQDKSLIEFSKSNGVSLDELFKVADEIGINIAVLDDLVQAEAIQIATSHGRI